MDDERIITDQLMDYNEQVKKENKTEKEDIVPLKLAIGTPCYGGQCYVDYMESVMNVVKLLRDEYDVETKLIFIKNDSLVTRARNNIIAKFMADPTLTHLLFIDADIGFHPIDVIKLLMDDKDIVGGIYPLKNYDFKQLNNIEKILEDKNKNEFNEKVSNEDYIRHNMMRYNVNYKDERDEKDNKLKVKDMDIEIRNNLMEVKYIPTGFMMIQKHVIEMMMEKYKELKYDDDCQYLNEEENKYLYALFDCEVVDGRYLSEDWLFCHRWCEMGGKIYTNITINLTHIGLHYFAGRYLSNLKIDRKKI